MPDNSEALSTKITLNFFDGTLLSNWNKVGDGLITDQSNTLQVAIPDNKVPLSLIIKYNRNSVDSINNIKAGITINPHADL